MATFNDAALSKLTAKIESKLIEPKKNQSKKEQDKKDQGKRKRDQTADIVQPPSKKRNNTSKPNGNKDNAKSKPPKPNGAPVKDTSNPLLDEIRALGGDEEDLKLVEDVDSEDEGLQNEEENKNTDKGLRAELAKFAAGLGFDNVQPESGTEESDDDINGADEPDEDEEDEEDASAPNADEKPLRDPKRKTVS